jgi:hypothetical protein
MLVVALSPGFSTVSREQTQYLSLTLRFSQFSHLERGCIGQSGNLCTPPPRLPNPLSSVTRSLTNQFSVTIVFDETRLTIVDNQERSSQRE